MAAAVAIGDQDARSFGFDGGRVGKQRVRVRKLPCSATPALTAGVANIGGPVQTDGVAAADVGDFSATGPPFLVNTMDGTRRPSRSLGELADDLLRRQASERFHTLRATAHPPDVENHHRLRQLRFAHSG